MLFFFLCTFLCGCFIFFIALPHLATFCILTLDLYLRIVFKIFLFFPIITNSRRQQKKRKRYFISIQTVEMLINIFPLREKFVFTTIQTSFCGQFTIPEFSRFSFHGIIQEVFEKSLNRAFISPLLFIFC